MKATLFAVAVTLTGLVGGCDTDPYYKTRAYAYGYTPNSYGYNYPAKSAAYAGRSEYYRDYRGIHPPAEGSPLR